MATFLAWPVSIVDAIVSVAFFDGYLFWLCVNQK